MKRLISTLLALFFVFSVLQFVSTDVFADSGVALTSTNFPDPNFLACVKTLDNGDNILTDSEIESIETIKFNSKNISSVQGINYLKYLKTVEINNNNIKTLDLDLPKLMNLHCSNNKITSIDFSKLPNLRVISCEYNELTEIDISNNTLVKGLHCNSNHIKKITFGENTQKLKNLNIYDNDLESIDLSTQNFLLDLYKNGYTTRTVKVNGQDYEVYFCSQLTSPVLEFCFDKDIDVLTFYNKVSAQPEEGGKVSKTFGSLPGQKVSISAQPDSKYKFVKWQEEVNGNLVDVSTKTTYSFVTSDSNRKFVAVFERLPESVDDYIPSDCVKTTAGPGGFIFRLYQYTFGRTPDDSGFDYWYDLLYNFKITGADAAKSFILSPEFASMNYSDEEFVSVLYKVFFDRDCNSDPNGKAYWLGLIESKTISRSDAVGFFVDSQEWADTCALGGIRSGSSISPKVKVYPNSDVKSFTERLYKTALGRDVDYPGMAYWAVLLASQQITGEEVGLQFFISKELQDQNITNEEFVNRLYLTFMGREGESSGMGYWVGLLDKGTSRESVVLGFTRSEEYLNLCIDARILPYRM